MKFATSLRNARAELIESHIGTSPKLFIYSGAEPAAPSDPDPSGMLVMMALPSDWESAASAGAISLLGTWSGTATGTGDPASYRIKDSSATSTPDTGTTYIQGTCAITTGGELLFDGSITAAQVVTIDAFGITDGNA